MGWVGCVCVCVCMCVCGCVCVFSTGRFRWFCCFFHFKFFCMHICLLTTFWVHRYTLCSDSCGYFSMKIVKIAGDVWNAATVLIFLPHKQEQTELLPSSKPFNNYGQRPRLSWKVNCIWNVIWHMDFFGKDGGWRWRVSELCPGT